MNITWISQLATHWQELYNNTSCLIIFYGAESVQFSILDQSSKYEDFKQIECKKTSICLKLLSIQWRNQGEANGQLPISFGGLPIEILLFQNFYF